MLVFTSAASAMQCTHPISSHYGRLKEFSLHLSPAGEENTGISAAATTVKVSWDFKKKLFYLILFRAENKCKPSTVFYFYARNTETLKCLTSGD